MNEAPWSVCINLPEIMKKCFYPDAVQDAEWIILASKLPIVYMGKS
jgi:hypothetical protein